MGSESLAHSKYICKYHIVFALKYRRQVIGGKIKRDIGKNAKRIEEYIRKQLQEDIANDQLSLIEYVDPFTGKQELM